MKLIRILEISVACALAAYCGNTNKTQLVPPPLLDLVSISKDDLKPSFAPVTAAVSGDFSFNIFKALSKDESICISPYSAAAVLSMATEGASGETEEQMIGVLGRYWKYRSLLTPAAKIALTPDNFLTLTPSSSE